MKRPPGPTRPKRTAAWRLTQVPKATSCAGMCSRPRDWSTRRSEPICPLPVVRCPLWGRISRSCRLPVASCHLTARSWPLTEQSCQLTTRSCQMSVASWQSRKRAGLWASRALLARRTLLARLLRTAPTEPTAESSLDAGPLSVVAEEGQVAGEASTLGEVAPNAPTEPTAESSLDRRPLSVVAEEGLIAGEASTLGEVAPNAPTEPTAVAGERKDNGKQTAPNDQPAPVPIPIPPTEPTLAACQMPSPSDDRPEMIPELAAIYRRLHFQARGREMTARELDLCRRLVAQARPPTMPAPGHPPPRP